MKKRSITFNLDSNNLLKAENFFSKYELVSMLGDTPEKFYLGSKTGQKCRFCKRSSPEVSFKKKPHIMPEFLGNRNLLSYFECDLCNSLFSEYEDSFANFFGASRTTAQIRGKKGKVPKYRDPRTGLEIEMSETGLKMSMIEGTEVFDLDEEKKSFTIKTKRPPYVPIYVPKMIIKMAFCMLKDEELEQFEVTRKFLVEKALEPKFKDFNLLRILGYSFPGPTKFPKPFIQLYQKREKFKLGNFPQYQILFFHANYQFQMTLPFGTSDEYLIGQIVDIPIAPLLLDFSHQEKYGAEQFLNLNLTSNEKQAAKDHKISFSFESVDKKDLTE